MASTRKIKVGLRGSKLSLKQGEIFSNLLKSNSADFEAELCTFKTSGDKRSDAFSKGNTDFSNKVADKEEWLFEIEQALIREEIDIALHSAKDVPVFVAEGTKILPLPNSASRADLLLTKNQFKNLDDLPQNAKIGTASLRRERQLLFHRPDLEIVPLRGNIDTRMSYLREGQFDAIVLAEAGLERLDLLSSNKVDNDIFYLKLHPPKFLPAVSQGILAVQVRKGGNEGYLKSLQFIENFTSVQEKAVFESERSLVRELNASCRSALGVYAVAEKGELVLSCDIFGSKSELLSQSISGKISEPKLLGESLANIMIEQGAKKILN